MTADTSLKNLATRLAGLLPIASFGLLLSCGLLLSGCTKSYVYEATVVLESEGVSPEQLELDQMDVKNILTKRLMGMDAAPVEVVKVDAKTLRIRAGGDVDWSRVPSALTRRGSLSLVMVDDDTLALRQLKGKLPEGVELVEAGYNRPNGERGNDIHLLLLPSQRDAMTARVAPLLPADARIGYGPASRSEKWRSYVLKKEPALRETEISNARPYMTAESPRPSLMIEFNDKGAAALAKVTRENVGRRLGIVVDGEVNSGPVIQSEIPGGSAQISMGGNRTRAEMMSDVWELNIALAGGRLPGALTLNVVNIPE